MSNPANPSSTGDPQAASGLPPRKFGFWVGQFVVVASMVGAGILTTSGFTLRETGNPGALLLLWLLGGGMALAGAFTVAEMAVSLPRSGGDYLFIREAYGRHVGFAAGVATFVVGFAGPTAVVALLAMNYLLGPAQSFLHRLLPDWLHGRVVPLGASLLLLGVTTAHCLGHRQSGGFQIGVTVVKLTVLLGLAILGLLVGQGDWSHLTMHWPRSGEWPALATGLIYVGYAYSGWNGSAYLAGEIREPSRLLPLTLIGGTLCVTALYLLLNLAYIYALDPREMMTLSPGQVEKVAELATARLFGQGTANVIGVLLGLSLIASVSAYMLIGPRVAYAMGADRVMPAWLGRLHRQRQVPVAATIAQGGLAMALIWSGSFLQILDFTSVGLAAVSGLLVASVFPLRRRKELSRPFAMPLYPWPPLLYLGLVGWTIIEQLLQPSRRLPALLSLAVLVLSIPLARIMGVKSVNRQNSI